jgi:hypothetical protein
MLMIAQGMPITISFTRKKFKAETIVRSPTTQDMIAISGTALYAFYPKLSSRNLAIGQVKWNPNGPHGQKLLERGCRLVRGLHEAREGPCGTECPTIWRWIADGKGIGVFHWESNVEVADMADDVLASAQSDVSNVRWSLGVKCSNPSCHNCI